MSSSPLDALPPPLRRFAPAAWERRRPIAAFVLVVMVVSAVVSLLLPAWYAAESTVLPPTEGGEAFGIMSGLIQGAALNRLGLFTTSSPSDVYVEILKSRTLREGIIHRFGLERLYRRRGVDRTLAELNRHMRVGATPAGVILVRVEDRDPGRAAGMANHLVSELDRFNRETLNTRAKRTRQFLESRLSDVREHLHAAESTLTAYEVKHGVVTDEGAVGGIAEVMAQKLSLQVKRGYVSSYSAPGSATIRTIDAEIGAYDRELSRLPGLKNEGARLALNAEIQRRVFTLLTAQYEDARVQEMRDTPTITVLDWARPPELRTRPRRSVIVLASTLMALALSAAWVGWSVRRTSTA
jgi:tyrosine-protein kinase Etk/Wzc